MARHRPSRSLFIAFYTAIVIGSFIFLFNYSDSVTLVHVSTCLTSNPPQKAEATKEVVQVPDPAPKPIQINEKDPEPQFCNYCTPTDEICKRYGALNLARSRSYEGPNARLKRVLRKARSGQPIKIGVLGGSVSAGQGVTPDTRWSSLYAQYIRETYDVEVILENGSVPATVSGYLETCFLNHISDDVDMVIIELSINDGRNDYYAYSYENLLRAVLMLPQKPAVINLQALALMFDKISTGGDLHQAIAQYYDTPVVSIRNILLPFILQSTEMNLPDTTIEDHWYHHDHNGIDLRHHGKNGHQLLADIVKSFTSRVACEGWREEQAASKHDTNAVGTWDWSPAPGEGFTSFDNVAEYIPRLSMFQKYDHETILEPVRPTCLIAWGGKNPLVALPAPLSTEGPDAFALWSHPSRPDKKWLTARKPGTKVAFAVTPNMLGRIRVTFLRSKTYGLGSMFCWIDDNRARGERLDGWWEHENMHSGNTRIIGNLVEPGVEHILHCEIMKETKDPGGGTEFRIISVDAL